MLKKVLAVLLSFLPGTLPALCQGKVSGSGKISGVGSISSTATVVSTARALNGTSDAMSNTAGTVPYLNSAGAFTIMGKIKSADLTQTNRYLYELGSGSNSIAVIYGYVSSGGKAELELYCPSCTNSPRTGSQIVIPDTTNWHTFAYNWDGTTLTVSLDGTTVNTVAVAIGMPATAAKVYVGEADNASGFFHGSVARFFVANAAIGTSAISTFAGPTCSTSGLTSVQGYWPSKGTSSPEPEASPSPNSNSLTLTGTTEDLGGPPCSSQ